MAKVYTLNLKLVLDQWSFEMEGKGVPVNILVEGGLRMP